MRISTLTYNCHKNALNLRGAGAMYNLRLIGVFSKMPYNFTLYLIFFIICKSVKRVKDKTLRTHVGGLKLGRFYGVCMAF